jgi:hypothetical protein
MKQNKENPKQSINKILSLKKFLEFTPQQRDKWQRCFVCNDYACIWTPDKLPAIQGFLFCYKHYEEHKQKNKTQGELF